MSPPAHLMLRGLPQRAASLELAWHAALRQKDIHTTECLYAPECCQPARANAMAKPPAHVLAPGQPHHSHGSGWLDSAAGSVSSAETSPVCWVMYECFEEHVRANARSLEISRTLSDYDALKVAEHSPAWCLLLSLYSPLGFTFKSKLFCSKVQTKTPTTKAYLLIILKVQFLPSPQVSNQWKHDWSAERKLQQKKWTTKTNHFSHEC